MPATCEPIPTSLAPDPESEFANTSENSARVLESHHGSVGDVVADYVEVLGSCVEPAQALLE
jgi:hypothetical protein